MSRNLHRNARKHRDNKPHDVSDVTLLVNRVEEVSHRTRGQDRNVVATVGLRRQWDCTLLVVLGITWERKGLETFTKWS